MNDENTQLPALDDEQGLQNLLQQQQMASIGIVPQDNGMTPQQTGEEEEIQGQGYIDETQSPGETTFTEAQVQAILQNYANAVKSTITPQQSVPQQQAAPTTQYDQRQMQLVNEAMRRGIPLEKIVAALGNERRTGQPDYAQQLSQKVNELQQRFNQIEQSKVTEQFESKLTALGGKLNLSERDLYTFGTKALENGINILYVNDIEAVFRGLYPDQYALRIQRAQPQATSQIYGGSNVGTTAQDNEKYAQQYAEQFLRNTMPNYYKK
jgi:hypothetical protein